MSAALVVTNLRGEVREHPDLTSGRAKLLANAFRARARSWFRNRWERAARAVRRSTTFAPCTIDTTVAIATLTLGTQQIRVCAFGDDFQTVTRCLEAEVKSASLWLVCDRRFLEHPRSR